MRVANVGNYILSEVLQLKNVVHGLTVNTDVTWNLVRNAESQAQPQSYYSQILILTRVPNDTQAH